MILSTMEEKATTSKTCKKVFSYHKLISESRKSRRSMTLQIEGIEFLSSVSRKAISHTTRKTKIMVQPISRPESQSLLPKHKAVMQVWKSRKPLRIHDKYFSITQHQAQRVSLPMVDIVKRNLSIIKCQLTNSTQTKTSKNFSRESSKWNSPSFTEITLQRPLKWKDQLFIQLKNNPEPDLGFTTQIIRPLKRIESIILTRSIRKLKAFSNAWMKMKRPEFLRNMNL